jgi:hypothetical protein|nr:MAG TPA: hypothetical protein [Caudoviricetes sp.]
MEVFLMAFLDRAGWMRTVEDVQETDPGTCRKAVRAIFSFAPTLEDATLAIYALGLQEYVRG